MPITGIGGIFFKTAAPEELRAWYADHLGLIPDEGGGIWFEGRDDVESDRRTLTVWGPLARTSDYFDPSDKPFMVNYRVVGLDPLMESLRACGESVQDEIYESEDGRFGWVMDPDGHRVELWEPTVDLPARASQSGPVTGLGSVFFKTGDPTSLKAWYAERLGVRPGPDGYVSFTWCEPDGTAAFTAWEAFPVGTDYFDPSDKPFMLNLRVRHLDPLLASLRAAGVAVDPRLEEHDYGRFGWFLDPDGHRVELWEPPRSDVPEDP